MNIIIVLHENKRLILQQTGRWWGDIFKSFNVMYVYECALINVLTLLLYKRPIKNNLFPVRIIIYAIL